LETARFPDKNEGAIQKANMNHNEIQDIKRNLDEGKKERNGIALGLCQWKDDLLGYQGRIWIPNDKGIRRTLNAKHPHTPHAGHGGTAKTTQLLSRRYDWPKIREGHQTIHQKF